MGQKKIKQKTTAKNKGVVRQHQGNVYEQANQLRLKNQTKKKEVRSEYQAD